MKVLVIGGSYFLGRWFVQSIYKEQEVVVINRGNVPVKLPGVREIVSDRHNEILLKEHSDLEIDCIVDFCAYKSGDINIIADIFGEKCKRYIYISTIDVYEKSTGNTVTVDSKLATDFPQGEEGLYISGKVCLEKELIECGKRYDFEYVSIRPAILYGPANYAPRESIYFEWIRRANQIILPSDSSSYFKLIYVRDVALGIKKICEMDSANIKNAYNFCGKNKDTYNSFGEALKEATGTDFEVIYLPVSEILEKNIPAPFPLSENETEDYYGDIADELGINVTSLVDGLRISYSI